MKAGQASAEQIMLLGMVLLVGLVVIGLLAFYPGTTEESKATASMAYWSSAQPIAIREAQGGTLGRLGLIYGTFRVVLKNLDKEQIIIKAIDISGSSNVGSFRAERASHSGSSLSMGDFSGAEDCQPLDHLEHKCNYVIGPGEELSIILMPQDNPQCGEAATASFNSLHKSVLMPVSIWYERNGVVQLEKSEVKLYAQCKDYFLCTSDQDCVYSGYGTNCTVANGACICPLCV